MKIYPFNPNYITENKAYFLGIHLNNFKKIDSFRKRGEFFQSKQQFKNVSGISDSLYTILNPYIKIPSFQKFNSLRKNAHYTTHNINKATALDLQNIRGIGKVLSERIIKYRESIDGFSSKNDLYKVYGLPSEIVDEVWQVFYLPKDIDSHKVLVKKAINMATAEDLKKVYGIGQKLSERIIRYRDKIGGFSIPEQLNQVYGLKPETLNKLWESFEIKNPKIIHNPIDLNDANIKELAHNPYIDYHLAKEIVSYRTLHGAFENFDELKKVKNFPLNQFKLIILYLKISKD